MSEAPSKRSRADATIDARVAVIDGMFQLPRATTERFTKIRGAIQRAAADVAEAVREAGEGGYDVGRLVAALDLLQQAKDVACVSLILPHHGKNE
jgi:hypothetical protein